MVKLTYFPSRSTKSSLQNGEKTEGKIWASFLDENAHIQLHVVFIHVAFLYTIFFFFPSRRCLPLFSFFWCRLPLLLFFFFFSILSFYLFFSFDLLGRFVQYSFLFFFLHFFWVFFLDVIFFMKMIFIF